MALDDATQALLAAMDSTMPPGAPPTWELSAQDARAAVAARRGVGIEGLPAMHATEEHSLSVDGGEIPVRIQVPSSTPTGVVVYYHGGGWVLGDVDASDRLGRMLAERTGYAVVIVGYRTAPEHRFPTAVDDAWTALEFAAAQRERIAGVDAPLVVMGDSAGGNLAAVIALRARDRGGPRIRQQVLAYPVTDADLTRPSYGEPENQTLLPALLMGWFWDQYLPVAADRGHPDASPLRAASLAGVAPAFVITAAHDVLRDEGEAYVARLAEEGVSVRHRRFDGQMHGFLSMVDALPASGEALDVIAAYLHEQSGSELAE